MRKGGIMKFAWPLTIITLIPLSASLAANTATVGATVTVQNISVNVTDGTITYGTLGQDSTKSTITSDLNDTQTATNNGNVPEDFNIKGTNSTDWQLSLTAGSNKYVHLFCTSTCGTPPTNFTPMSSTSYQQFGSNVAAAGNQTFELQIHTPNPSTVFTQQSVDVTVQAVAH